MSFNILDYLEDLVIVSNKHTWIQAKCPVCDGKLKINKNTGSYACYTSNCHQTYTHNKFNLIKHKLNKYTKVNTSPFHSYKARSKLPILLNTEPLTLEDINSTYDFRSDIPYLQVLQTKVVSTEFQNQYNIKTFYDYKDFIIVRVDKFVNNVYDDKGGYILNKQGEKQVPTSFDHLPVYKTEYLQSHLVVVEGEKCADALHKLGIAAIALPSFAYSLLYIEHISKLLYLQSVRYVVILIDNDLPGQKKGELIYNYFSLSFIKCKIVNIYTDLQLQDKVTAVYGYDIADYISDTNATQLDILKVIEICLSNSLQQ